MAATPVAVEVWRGERVESRHRVRACVADPDGRVLLALGDIDEPVYPRSAVKPFQALALVESGAADAFGVGPTRAGAGLRLAWRRAGSCGPGRGLARPPGPGRDGTRLRPARPPAPAVGHGHAARRHGPFPHPQQLLGQACRDAGGGLAAGRTDPWLRAAAARRAAPLRRCDRGPGRPRPAARARDRRLRPAQSPAAAARPRPCGGDPGRPARGSADPSGRADPHRGGDARAAAHGRRHRPLLHRADGAPPGRDREDRRRGRLSGGAPGARARHRDQGRGRCDPRRGDGAPGPAGASGCSGR